MIKVSLIALSLITFIISIFSIILMLVSTIISSYCDFSLQILEQTDFTTFFKEIGFEMEEKEMIFFNLTLHNFS